MILVANDRSNQALSNKLVSNDMGSLFEVPDAQICQKWQSYILAAINESYINVPSFTSGASLKSTRITASVQNSRGCTSLFYVSSLSQWEGFKIGTF